MKLRASALAAALYAAAISFAANGPPLAGVWNIEAKGQAASSGDLHFRIRQNDGSDPLDIRVRVSAGAKETTIARGIRDSLDSQLPAHRFKVELGEGSNVLVSDSRGQPNFSVELLDSDIDELRVAVQGVTPMASPTVPEQAKPAEPPVVAPASSDAPGAVIATPGDTIPVPGSGTGVPDNSPRVPNASPPAPVTPAAPSPSPPPAAAPAPAPAPEPAPTPGPAPPPEPAAPDGATAAPPPTG